MIRHIIAFFFCVIVFQNSFSQTAGDKKARYVLVIHGGAGTILRNNMTPAMEKAYEKSLENALLAGNEILKSKGSAIDAVEAAVRILEDDSLFNAGKGAVFTNEGKNELDAAIMDGKTLAAGSVAGVTIIKNPVSAARAVMEKSPHVMMTGTGAEKFAQQQGLEIVGPSYFFTESRWLGLQKALQKENEKKAADSLINHLKKPGDEIRKLTEKDSVLKMNASARNAEMEMAYSELFYFTSEGNGIAGGKFGTVGAVALDQYGNLAAATSTGGMTNKRYGRVGDAPVIGSGTYANNNTAAISCTGWGEYFIRLVMAKTISDMMEFGKMKLQDAATEMVMKRLPALGGDGGLIAVDKYGNIAMPFCTPGMYRAFIRSNGEISIKIYRD